MVLTISIVTTLLSDSLLEL